MESWDSGAMVDASMAASGRQFQTGGVSPRFFIKTVEDKKKAKETGEPEFKDVEYVELRIPGDRTNIPQEPVTNMHRKMYAAQYQHWKATKENPANGRPLDQLPAIMGSQIETLRYHGVHSIEELGSLSDELLTRLPTGYRALVKRANDWLSGAKGNAGAEKLRVELSARDAELEKVRADMALLKAQMEALAGAKVEELVDAPKRTRAKKANKAKSLEVTEG